VEPPATTEPLPSILHGRVVPTPSKVTWEPIAKFNKRYPEFQLTDELFAGEGGNVADSFLG
jgi:hypothetical protein